MPALSVTSVMASVSEETPRAGCGYHIRTVGNQPLCGILPRLDSIARIFDDKLHLGSAKSLDAALRVNVLNPPASPRAA
jgi:hypothetical protein